MIPKAVLRAFLSLEGTLYALFLGMDLAGLGAWSIWPKYAGILLCLALSWAISARGGAPLVAPALTLTALADLFLLVLGRFYLLGVALFLVVQTLYLLRLRGAGAGPALGLRTLLSLALGLLVWKAGLLSPLNLLCALYFAQLLSNACLSWTLRGARQRAFSLGLTLFVGCDLCVGLFNLPGLVPEAIHSFAQLGMWLFYLPSQVLITLSAIPEEDCP